MSEAALYEIGLRFSVDNTVPPPRRALHGALETVRAVIVEASNGEEAEAQVDQIRLALENYADRGNSLFIGKPRDPPPITRTTR
jgi:hypothetical protein